MLRYCCLGLAMAFAFTTSAWGELVHQYTFNEGNVDDSVGGAHGTVVNPMGVSAFHGGQLDLRSNNTETNGNISSNQATEEDPTAFTMGVYADLPNFTISEAAGPGGVLSFEAWVTIETNRTWSRIFDFGTSNQGEDTAFSGDQSEYIFLTATNGGGNVEFTTRSFDGINGFAVGPSDPPPGGQHHYVTVLDQTDTTVGANGSLYLYLDGERVGEGPVADGMLVESLFDENNWLGRSQWPDPLLDGTYNEFRIYDHALSEQEVQESFNTGPEAVNPRFIVNRDDQTITMVSRGLDGDLAGYSLTSASGSLNAEAWTPISGRLDDGTFDDVAWDIDSSTVDELAESASSGTGGEITSATSISLGTAWFPSPVEDLIARVQLADGSVVGGEVVFEGNDGNQFQRSDLNFDGVVDADDWTVFVSNLFGDFSGMSGAQAYGMGDLNGDLMSDVRDFRLFQADFTAANGAAAFGALAGVPEPSTAVLAIVLLAAAVVLVRHRSRGERLGQLAPVRARALLPLAGVALVTLSTTASGELVHRWSFNETGGTVVQDFVGGADGEILGDGGLLGGGVVSLPGGPSDSAAYVDLPNGIVSRLTDATFEGWAVIDGAQNWGRLFDFGSSNIAPAGEPLMGGEVVGPGGGGEGIDYLQYAASRGPDVNLQRLGFRNLDPEFGGDEAGNVSGAEQLLDTSITTPIGEEFHYAVVFDSDANQMRTYRNGQFVAAANVTHELGNLNDVNNWLGRSNWTNDANFEGSFNEFRIYDTPLDDFEIGTSFIGGPDVGEEGPPVLELEVDRGTGQAVLHNRQIDPIDFQFYEVVSPAGALNVNGWTSLDSRDIDSLGSGPGESWDEGGGSDNSQLGEAFLLGNTSLGSGESIDLGNLYNPAVFGTEDGDLQFRYLRGDGLAIAGMVSYVGEGGGGMGIPGDFNNNGLVEQEDLDLVLANWGDPASQAPATWTNDPPEGNIDQTELDKVLVNWGNTAGLGAAAGVPEPTSAVVAALALLAAAVAGAKRFR